MKNGGTDGLGKAHFVQDERLSAAIGRVAQESALFDEFLRELLDRLVGPSDHIWLLFEGQPSEWLLETTFVMLEQVDPYFRKWSAKQRRGVEDLLNGARRLRPLRNAVIHGVWSYVSIMEPEDIRSRPWGEADSDEPVYFCTKSRFRKVFAEARFAASDVERLANEFAATYSDLRDRFREMLPSYGAGLFSRW